MEMKHRVLLTVLSGAASAAFSVTLGQPAFPVLSAALASSDSSPELDRPTSAAAPKTKTSRAAKVSRCYDRANLEQVKLDTQVTDPDYGVAYDSGPLTVKRGSPCRDVNARRAVNLAGPAKGQQACTLVTVLRSNGSAPVGWADVCGGWEELMRFAPEGEVFVLRAALRPVEVTVAT